MAQLSIDKTYADGTVPFELDLNNIRDAALELFNIIGINDDSLQDVGITASTKFQDDTVTALKVSSAALNSTNFANDNVNISIADLGVETADILNTNITTDKFLNETITGDDFPDASIEYDKIGTETFTTDGTDPGKGGYSSFPQTISDTITENNSFTDIEVTIASGTPLKAEITTNGGPVTVSLTAAAFLSISGSRISASRTGTPAQGEYRLTRDGTPLCSWRINAANGNCSFGPQLEFTDDVAAGNYEYRVQFRAEVTGQANRTSAAECRLLAFEL